MSAANAQSAVMPTYGRSSLAFERGEGPYLFTKDGQRYLDFGSGIAVTALGHCHPKLVEAAKDQAEKLWHVSNLYVIPEQEQLAKTLTQGSFADQVFFSNSGAEALEGSIKTARKYMSAIGQPERYRVITASGAFHGRTLATMSATGAEKILSGFGPKVDGFDHVPFGNMNALRDAITPETAAILVEPLQGEGGVVAPPKGYLEDLRATADEFGILLIFDEVQCGIGRTGKLFAHQWSEVTPDIMSLAKGLGGGFPIGAVLATEKAAQGMQPGSHGSTFGGNPMSARIASTVVEEIQQPAFLDRVQKAGAHLREKLEALAKANPKRIKDIRGQGLMVGIGFQDDTVNMDVVNAAYDNQLLLVPAGENTARMLPALIVTDEHINEAVEKFEAALTSLNN